MQLVTDRGMDLAPDQLVGLDIHIAPLRIELNGKTYRSGVDISSEEFYKELDRTGAFPTTSQPSPGDFAELYRMLAKKDPDILSLHISAGLSGTMNSARQGAELVPEANVTFVDSMTLSVPFGWQVQAAALAIQDGWPLADIVEYLKEIQANTDGIYTLGDLRYLIHGGRIGHLKGLLASVLQIKPIIQVDKVTGKYIDVAKERTLKRAIRSMAHIVADKYGKQGRVRVQLLHGYNLPGLEMFKEQLSKLMDIYWDTPTPIAPVLGAHTGPSMVGLSAGPLALFERVLGDAVQLSNLSKNAVDAMPV